MREKITERLHVMLPPSTKSDLGLAARFLNVSEGELVREALAGYPRVAEAARRARQAGLTSPVTIPALPPAIPGLDDADIRMERQLVTRPYPHQEVARQ